MHRLILAAVLALVACGPSLPPPRPLGGASADPDEQVECHDERTTGTNMARPVCLTHDQIEENRRAAKEWEKHPRSSPTDNH